MLFRLTCVIAIFAAHCLAADQDILTILGQQSGIGSFISLLEGFPDLVETLDNGTFTLIVPNDEAISQFSSDNPDATTDTGALRALLEYHIVHDTHPTAQFGLEPLFAHTLLVNSTYANVTNGQVIDITKENNTPVILSGVKAVSRIAEGDIFFQGGLIHIVDAVLTIPISFPATITRAGLTDLVALLNKGGWLNPSSPAVGIVNNLPDLTIFGPNDPRFGPTFTGFDSLTEEDLLRVLQYHIISGHVLYSSEFQNNTKLLTLDGIQSTMTELNGNFYIDNSTITTRDFITSNGVLQVLDSVLNPNTTDARPELDAPPAKSGGGGLSAAAGAGIGIALGALLLGGALITALILRKRRQRGMTAFNMGPHARIPGESQRSIVTDSMGHNDPPPPFSEAHELENKTMEAGVTAARAPSTTTTTHVFEIHHSPKPSSCPQEIDGRERSQINITIQGSPPRHLGFQAKY